LGPSKRSGELSCWFIGGSIVLIGIALIVLPGPAFVVIPVGLAILATEFAWARHWLKKARRLASRVVSEQERQK